MAGQHLREFTIPAGSTAPIVLTGFGHAPEALVASWNGRSDAGDAAGQVSARRGIGFAIGSAAGEQIALSNRILDGLAASSSTSEAFPGRLVGIDAGGQLSVASIDPDGVTLRVNVAFNAARTIQLLSLGPELVAGKSLTTHSVATATGDQDLDLGLQPDAILLASIGRFPADASFTTLMLGMAAGPSGSIEQNLLVGYGRANGSSADTRRYCRRGYALGISSEAPNVNALVTRATISDWLPTGARLNYDAAQAAVARTFAVLALQGPGFRCGQLDVGDEATSGLPFVPRGGVFVSAGQLESADALAMQVHDVTVVGLAALDDAGLAQGCVATRSQDATSTVSAGALIDHDAVVSSLTSAFAVNGVARLGAARNDGLDVENPTPFADDVFVGFLTFGAAQPALTGGRLATVDAAASPTTPLATFTREPSSTLDYGVEWDTLLRDANGALTDALATSAWAVPAGLTLEASPPTSFAGTQTRAWLSGGTAGQSYSVVNRVATTSGRVLERTIRIKVKDL